VTALLVALGAAVGAPLRFLAAHHLDGRLPRGTLLVNLLGSGLLGFCAGQAVDGDTLALVGTGFCGGLTTYSAFSVQVVDRGRLLGVVYAVATVVLAVAAAALGYAVAQA
jgi:fluoride exporter